MKIAVVGAGALGSYYGAKLARAGEDVRFLLRSDYAAVKKRGLRILSAEGDFHINPKIAERPEVIGPSDLVLIGLKTTANDHFPELLPPLVGPNTKLLTLQNGLGNEAALAAIFGEQRVMGGLAFVCLNREEPGVIRHLAHGKITLGEHNRWPEPFTHDVATMFRRAGIPCKVTDNLDAARWRKLVWNIPFNGLGVAAAAGYDAVAQGETQARKTRAPFSTDLLLADPRWAALVRGLMAEVIAAAGAEGHPIEPEFIEEQIADTQMMRGYKPSTVIDYEQGRPLELYAIFLEPLRRAQANGLASPLLENLCKVLTSLAKDL